VNLAALGLAATAGAMALGAGALAGLWNDEAPETGPAYDSRAFVNAAAIVDPGGSDESRIYRITIPGLQSDKPSPDPPLWEWPASAEGLRLWSNGDSTSYFMTVALLSLLEAQGGIPMHEPDYVISSGLMNPGYFDWPAFLAAEMGRADPDIVVFMLGANDAVGQPDLEVYRSRVAEVMDLLRRPGRFVIWVGQPTIDAAVRPALAAYVPLLNRVFAEEAAKREWVRYVDAQTATAGADGAFAKFLPDETGQVRSMRADDGVHLSSAGGRLIALEVVEVLFAR
jgi:hypothetical protein